MSNTSLYIINDDGTEALVSNDVTSFRIGRDTEEGYKSIINSLLKRLPEPVSYVLPMSKFKTHRDIH